MALATVRLRIVGGEVIPEIEILKSETVLDLKEKIKTTLNVDVIRQTLKFNNQVLMNDQTIGHWNLEQKDSVVLCVKPLSGQPKFNIFVEDEFGKTTDLKVKECTLVLEVKWKLDKRDFGWGTLKYRSVEMDDDFPLSAYYVCEDSKLELTYDLS